MPGQMRLVVEAQLGRQPGQRRMVSAQAPRQLVHPQGAHILADGAAKGDPKTLGYMAAV